MIPARMDADKIMELADYYMAERAFGVNALKQQRADINRIQGEKAAVLLKDGPHVKTSGAFVLNNRTPERNMRHIFGDSQGDQINAWLFDPVAENEAERYRFVNRMHDQVRAIEGSNGKKRKLTSEESALVQKVIEGRAAEEAVTGLEMGEAIRNAAENIRNGSSLADAAQEFSLGARERKLADQYARWLETKEALENGTADKVRVENAVKVYTELFDQMYDAINDFLVVMDMNPLALSVDRATAPSRGRARFNSARVLDAPVAESGIRAPFAA